MVRLERPALPAIERRLRWPGTVVAVFGRDAASFAERMARGARERSVTLARASLRSADLPNALRANGALRTSARSPSLGAPARAIGARAIRVELRHREGSTVRGDPDLFIACAPDALSLALGALDADCALTIGAGVAFAAAVESDVSVWIRAGDSPLALPEAERALAKGARLVLEDARPGVADALVERLIRAGSAARTGL